MARAENFHRVGDIVALIGRWPQTAEEMLQRVAAHGDPRLKVDLCEKLRYPFATAKHLIEAGWALHGGVIDATEGEEFSHAPRSPVERPRKMGRLIVAL